MWKVLEGDVRKCLKGIKDKSVQCVITSPPYFGLRDYGTATWEGGNPECDHKHGRFERGGLSSKQGSNKGSGGDEATKVCPKCGAIRVDNQIGLEGSPEDYISNMVEVFREVKRVLRDDGVIWLNLGDSYAGNCSRASNGGRAGFGNPRETVTNRVSGNLKPKDLIGIPWSVAFALRDDGWYLRAGIPWLKGNPMPESTKDRPTANVEYFFLLSKGNKYYYDAEATRVPMSDTTKKRDEHCFNSAFKGQFKGTPNEYRWQDGREIKNPKFYNEKGRYRRVVDWFMDSLQSFLNRENGTLLHDDEGNPLAVFCNTKPYKGAHFATFPEALITPMILAGTSPKACEACGSAWKRVVDVEKGEEQASLGPTKEQGNLNKGGATYRPILNTTTTGWQPTCTCEQNGIGKCVVLDFFVGSGTTLYVSEKLGRDSVGIDLNSDYLSDLVKERMKVFEEKQDEDGEGIQQDVFSLEGIKL